MEKTTLNTISVLNKLEVDFGNSVQAYSYKTITQLAKQVLGKILNGLLIENGIDLVLLIDTDNNYLKVE